MKTKHNYVPIIINSVIIALLVIGAITLTFIYWPEIRSLRDPAAQEEFKQWLTSFGFAGFFVLLAIQVLQVVVPFIPGEIMEILAGVMFGPWLGTLLCLLGIVLSVLIIYGLVSILGKPFTNLFLSDEIKEKWKFLQNSDRVEAIYLYAFLLPGTPKDILVYLAATMKVKLTHLLVIASIGRIPSIVLSTFFGGAIINENSALSIIILVINIVVFIVGVIFNKAIIKFLERKFITRGKASK